MYNRGYFAANGAYIDPGNPFELPADEKPPRGAIAYDSEEDKSLRIASRVVPRGPQTMAQAATSRRVSVADRDADAEKIARDRISKGVTASTKAPEDHPANRAPDPAVLGNSGVGPGPDGEDNE